MPVPPGPAKDPQHPPVADAVPPDVLEDLRAFVGVNAPYFLGAWWPALTGHHGSTGFNRAAFFLGGFYLAYRRMYAAGFAYYAVVLAWVLADKAVFCWLLGLPQTPRLWQFVTGFATAIVTGALANRWYLRHARRVVDGLRARDLSDTERRLELAARGGVDVVGAVGVLVASVLAFVVLGVAVEVLFGPGVP